MKTRLLVIGLDACDKDLVLRWAADGSLPTFRRLLEVSVHGETVNPAGFFGGTVWPSFLTGVSPARHGRFCAIQAPRGSYAPRPFGSNEIQGTPFWESVSQAGRRVAVIDVPLSRPVHQLNGLQVVDLATHDPFFRPPVSCPPALIKEVTTRFGAVAPDQCDHTESPGERFSRVGIEKLVNDLLLRLRTKGEVSRHYLNQGGWDLFVTVFSESHCVGHHCWHVHDASHPSHDRKLASEVDDPVRRVYQALDTEVGKLLEGLDSGTQVIVLLSHGMRRVTNDCATVLDEILYRLDPATRSVRSNVFRLLKQTWYSLPVVVRRRISLDSLKSAAIPGLRRALVIPQRRYRKFFAIPADTSCGAIRINLAGRESSGRVAPGDEYLSVIENLRHDFSELVDSATSTSFVKAIHFTPDLFDGPYLDQLPDLLLEWNQEHHFSAVYSKKIGTVRVPEMIGRTGDHQNAGMFFGLRWGVSPAKLKRAVPIVDFAPTIGQLLGVSIDGVDGRIIDEFLLPRRDPG